MKTSADAGVGINQRLSNTIDRRLSDSEGEKSIFLVGSRSNGQDREALNFTAQQKTRGLSRESNLNKLEEFSNLIDWKKISPHRLNPLRA